ncbi:hypothetical protein RI129_001877 [Pyrocoelia pectoralis]|uniref:Anoctamin n=1 Tax=Pyrocoelia pectoralis TaxID=417401 RepID=A0AAN7VYM0_9COLE
MKSNCYNCNKSSDAATSNEKDLQISLHTSSEHIKNSKLMYLKVHGPKDILIKYADAFNIPLACNSEYYQIDSETKWIFMKTELADRQCETFRRASKSSRGERPSDISTTEKVMVINKILNMTYFGVEQFEYGVAYLIAKKIFLAAYPLHSCNWRWTEDGDLSKLQLLAQFWAHINMWYKEQPLNLIERYFGPEVAVYFAFCGFYNKMLIIASVVGILCIIFGFFATHFWNSNIIKEACERHLKICPPYFSVFNWKFTYLDENCGYAKAMSVFDNMGTVFFSFFMAFWATVFIHLWKRYYATLSLHWNIRTGQNMEELSTEYQEHAYSPPTDTNNPYRPYIIAFKNNTITVIVCTFLMLIVLAAVFGTILYRLSVTDYVNSKNIAFIKRNITFFTIGTGSLLSVGFIKLFGKWYGKISIWLTKRENPRTQVEFDRSYIHKRFLLSFVNSYAMLVYISFVKGKLYTYPGDVNQSWLLLHLRADVCHPAGCIMGVCIQLAAVILCKSLMGNALNVCISVYKKYFYKIPPSTFEDLPRWEHDFELEEVGRYFLVTEYMNMVIQYGFVTFFAAAFPLAPLCALINNIIELRNDANKYVRRFRRPIPVYNVPIKVWNNLLGTMTSFSIVSNAFIIAFTSNFVKRELYRFQTDFSLKGFINSTLSVFDPKDFEGSATTNHEACYYRGQRNPPGSQEQYELSSHFWYETSVRFMVAIIFEHIVLMFTGILSSMVSNVPLSVQTKLKNQESKLNENKMAALSNIPRGTNVFDVK